MNSIAKGDDKLDHKPVKIEESRAEVRDCGIGYGSRVPKSENISRVLERNVSQEEDSSMSGVLEGSDVNSEIGEEEKSRVSEVKNEKSPSFVQFDLQNDRFGARRDGSDANEQKPHGYKTLLSEFDDFVANEKHGAMEGESRALSYGFEVGDLVWGKVKSHPWWPGHIFNEVFASPSVRRTRREGYVLVAFFGDSSYGWFDPAELIPFVPHYAEKSQQTSSRNFVRAVEEAMDEACRRQGLGLACRCRNRYNFRPTDVQSYFEVDVPDYEPRGVYSENQIKKAWDAFQPGETLSFVKQMAFAPQECNQSTFEFIKNKATVFALRRAVFEEFDETYAQAFGAHSKRPANDPAEVSNQPVKQPTRAPLSGPLVIAEALSGGKTSRKPGKVKDPSKKDRYLIKRRDESIDSKALQIGQQTASSPSVAPLTPLGGSSQVTAGEFVLQKRTLTSASSQHDGSSEVAGSSEDKDLIHAQAIPSDNDVGAGSKSTSVSEKSSKRASLGVADSASLSMQQEVDVENEFSAKVTKSNEGSHLIENLPAKSEGDAGSNKLLDAPDRVVGDAAGVKKVQVNKRPSGDVAHEDSISKEKKKKKKQPDTEANPDRPKKKLKTGGLVAGKSIPFSDLEVPHLLSNLYGFALDPFRGVEKGPPVALQFFLRFRSLYFQKSAYNQKNAVSSPPSSDPAAEKSSTETSSKPIKSLPKNGDPTKAGQKRLPSDRQEEIAAKRLKKITQIKSLATEKKIQRAEAKEPGAAHKIQRAETKEPVSAAPPKAVRPNSVKKAAPQARESEPAMLIMKFPPQTSLPSHGELKAKLARFGAIDQSTIRIFWATSTCRVVFRHKGDALAAHRYGVANNSLFNDLNVKYSIREVGAPATEASETDKTRGEDRAVERQPVVHQPIIQSNIQPKSILKKSTGEETGTKGTARVKFMLGGEESSGNRNYNNNASFADGGAMDFNSNNFQKVIVPPTSASVPMKAPISNSHTHTTEVVAPRNTHKINSAPDISQPMLSLLARCNDVVTSVTGLLGYVPYHPL